MSAKDQAVSILENIKSRKASFMTAPVNGLPVVPAVPIVLEKTGAEAQVGLRACAALPEDKPNLLATIEVLGLFWQGQPVHVRDARGCQGF